MTVADVIALVEKLAPPGLAMPGDPIGLHVGDSSAPVSKIATSVDPSRRVIDKAASLGAQMLVCHHPLIYNPLASIRASEEKGDLIMRAIKAGLAVYVAHTNLDSASGGINDTLAALLGLSETRLLSVSTTEAYVKVVVFTPEEAVEAVRAAMCGAGGFIGNYSDCSFRTKGIGTFKPLEGARPYIGKTGELEQTDEWRLETLCPESALQDVSDAMLRAHPYEEVAYDVYPLRNEPRKFGLGLVGQLAKAEPLGDFRACVENALSIPGFTRMWGSPRKKVKTVALCAGSGSSLIDHAVKSGADVFLVGELKYSSVLTAEHHGLAVIDAGHYQTEKPGVDALTQRLAQEGFDVVGL